MDIKISANQGGPFSQQVNLVDFVFGEDGSTYDLNRSYVNLMCSTDVLGGIQDAVYDFRLRYSAKGALHDFAIPDVAVVRHCNLNSSKVGSLESIRRVDILRTNLNILNNTIEDKDGVLYKTIEQHSNRGELNSVFRELKGIGSTPSRDLVAPIQIPLSQLFELGVSKVNTSKLGTMKVHLELQPQVLSPVQYPKTVDDQTIEYIIFEDVTAVGELNTFRTAHAFNRLEDSPYWVSQALVFSGLGNGGAPVIDGETRVISSIVQVATGADAGKLDITFSVPLATLTTGQSYTEITVFPHQCESISLQIDYAELVLRKDADEPMDMLVYSTYTSEDAEGNSLTSFNQQFMVEPNCFNLLAMPISEFNDLLCFGATESFRWTIDNVDATNRNVVLKSALHYDRLAMYQLNAGKRLKSLILAQPNQTAENSQGRYELNPINGLMPQPVPMTQNRKICNLNVESGVGGLKKMILWKQVARQVKL